MDFISSGSKCISNRGTGSTIPLKLMSPVLPHYFTVNYRTCNSVPSEVVIINPVLLPPIHLKSVLVLVG
jgi:hypothetical protein